MQNEEIRVVIIDDHPGVRAGLKGLLRMAEDITIVGEGADGIRAIELAREAKPDILLLDVELPILRGDVVMRRIHDAEPAVHVLVVSAYDDRNYIQAMLANGASGYITKDEAPALLLEAIYGIHRNQGLWMSPRALQSSRADALEEQTLTDRELQILRLLLQDLSEPAIAKAMHMDDRQVHSYLRLLMDKFDAASLDTLRAIGRRMLSPGGRDDARPGDSEGFLL
ncbi:MAG TPA: response regulator transcription factor [Anaerolineales bacterium]